MKKRIPILKKGYTLGMFFTLTLSLGLGGFLTAQEITNQSIPNIIATVPLSEQHILPDIIQNRITILEVNRSRTSVVVLVSAEEFAWLSSMNFSPEIVSDKVAIEHGWKYSAEFKRDFHSYSQMTTELQTIASTYPDITRLYDLGQKCTRPGPLGIKNH